MYSAELVQILKAGRETLNAKYFTMNAYGHPIDQDDWREHLQKVILPLVEKILVQQPESAWKVLESLYDVSLELFSTGAFAKNRIDHQTMELWTQVLPHLPQALVKQPRLISASLSNAVLALSRTSSNVASAWVDILARSTSSLIFPEEVLKFGQVAAWVAGTPNFRRSCLPLLAELSPHHKALLLGEPGAVTTHDAENFFAAFARSPWPVHPKQPQTLKEQPIRRVACTGNFIGLGGKFTLPPKVCLADQQIHVILEEEDSVSVWRLEADCFGTDFLPITEFKGASSSVPGAEAGSSHVRIGNAEIQIRDFAQISSFAFDGTTLAVSLEDSFHIYLFTAGDSEP